MGKTMEEHTEERTADRLKKALDLFEQAVTLPVEARETLLNSTCAGDASLRQTVHELLAFHQQSEADGFLEAPAWSYSPPTFNPQAMVGQQIGTYRLTRFLAGGGMGLVYLAEHTSDLLRRQAAVKLVRADLDPRQYRRFRREVRILETLKHPNLVLLYDAGRLADGSPYLVMEYVEGESLHEWRQRQGSMPPTMVIEVMKQACAGLQAAHEAGVIHRDIKPGNIMLSEANGQLTVKVLDFGIAARKDTDESRMSQTSGAIGTPLYMSPEQLRGTNRDDLTAASDVYALGLTAYELLTGQPAIAGSSQAEIISHHLFDLPPLPSQIKPGLNISAAIDQTVMKALAKDPHERYQSARAFADALTEAITADQKKEQQADSATSAKGIVSDEKKKQPRRYAKTAALVVMIVTGALGAYLFTGRQPGILTKTSPPDTASPLSNPLNEKTAKGLRILLDVQDTKGRLLPGSRVAIFKKGIVTLPATINRENALILSSDQHGHAETEKPVVESGEYLLKVVCVGYRSITDKVVLREDSARPGTVRLVLTLAPE